METIVIKPRIKPRNLIDGFISMLVSIPMALYLFVLPVTLVLFLSRSMILTILAYIIIPVVFSLFCVWCITLSPDGIKFKRILGSPRFINWKDVVEIKEVSRRELVCKGWYWPPFPPREMTASLTSIGHYRIVWKNGFCYYPPSDGPSFERYVAEFQHKVQPFAMPEQ